MAQGAVAPIDPAVPRGIGGPAGDSWVPVVAPLAGLLPQGALRRGSVITVSGSASLLLALLAEVSSSGGWCAEVGSARLGAAAAAELGIALDRFVRIPQPGERWPEVVAALLDGFDVVVVHPWTKQRGAERGTSEQPTVTRGRTDGGANRGIRVTQAVRRLTARARDRRAVVLASWPWEGASITLSVAAQRWHGLGAGHGCLAAREVEVVSVGRGSAVRPRRTRVWLPGPDGRVASYEDGLAALDRTLPPVLDRALPPSLDRTLPPSLDRTLPPVLARALPAGPSKLAG